MTTVTLAEIRAAREYLQGRGGVARRVVPSDLARAAKELGKNLHDTLRFVALLLSGGSGVGPSPIATAGRDRIDPVQALGDAEKELQNGPED